MSNIPSKRIGFSLRSFLIFAAALPISVGVVTAMKVVQLTIVEEAIGAIYGPVDIDPTLVVSDKMRQMMHLSVKSEVRYISPLLENALSWIILGALALAVRTPVKCAGPWFFSYLVAMPFNQFITTGAMLLFPSWASFSRIMTSLTLSTALALVWILRHSPKPSPAPLSKKSKVLISILAGLYLLIGAYGWREIRFMMRDMEVFHRTMQDDAAP